jgi:hypothetical protein
MAAQPFKPQTLRAVLIVLLIAVLSLGAGVFYLGLKEVDDMALEVNHSIADAEASKLRIQKLQVLKNQLSQSDALVAKANQVFATPSTYESQALTDIRTYAAASGLTIEKTEFSPPQTGTNPSVTVNLASPVSYAKLINFLSNIESNMPKMQVINMSISRINGGNANLVTVDDMKIMIATRT